MRSTDPAFLASVNHEDELLMVMRVHQQMDDILSDLIEWKLVEKHHLELRRIPCAVRIELAAAMGLLMPGDRGTFLQFNTLRNRFAHEPGTTINEKDAQDLYNGVSEHMRTALSAIRCGNYDAFNSPLHCVRAISMGLVIMLERMLDGLHAALNDKQRLEDALVKGISNLVGKAIATHQGASGDDVVLTYSVKLNLKKEHDEQEGLQKF